MIKKILREPLLHFLLTGALLYIYYEYKNVNTDNKKGIEISPYEIEQIRSEYSDLFSKEINDAALKTLTKRLYYEKMLLQEAYALKLHEEDPKLRDMLIRKMDHILKNDTKFTEPSVDELRSYYKQHINDYSHVKNISFSHIFFNTSNKQKADELLWVLNISEVNAKYAQNYGENSIEQNHINKACYEDILKMFGNYFAFKLFNLKKGSWYGPIRSKYGLHLVYVSDKIVKEPYSFDEVQERVYEDYLTQRTQERYLEAFKKIKRQYSMQID